MEQASRSTQYRYYKQSISQYAANMGAEQGEEDGRMEFQPVTTNGVANQLATAENYSVTTDMCELSGVDEELNHIADDTFVNDLALSDCSISDGDSEPDVFEDCQDNQECGDSDGDLGSPGLRRKIATWAIDYGISHAALTALLLILSAHSALNLPKHVATLLATPQLEKPLDMGGGEYHFFGLSNTITGGATECVVHHDTVGPGAERPFRYAGHCVGQSGRAPFPKREERQKADCGHRPVRRYLRNTETLRWRKPRRGGKVCWTLAVRQPGPQRQAAPEDEDGID